MMNAKPVAIVGASGYSGEELVRLLLAHPHVELAAVTSRQYAGRTLAQIFPRFAHHPRARTLRFSEPNPAVLAKQAQVVFLALPHGVAAEYAVPLLELGCQVIDLSADFRVRSAAVYQEFYAHEHPAPELLARAVYGLPEIYRAQIKPASLIASPGCYPTSILLPTLPLLKAGLVAPEGIIANSLSGVSGAGRKVDRPVPRFDRSECSTLSLTGRGQHGLQGRRQRRPHGDGPIGKDKYVDFEPFAVDLDMIRAVAREDVAGGSA